MYLSPDSVVDLLKKPIIDNERESCIKHDSRSFFHTEPVIKVSDLKYYKDFNYWVERLIAGEKNEVFRHLNILPLQTVDFTEGVFSPLKKIFSSQDFRINSIFKSEENEKDSFQYLTKIKDSKFWSETGFSAMKSSVNSIVVVDLPETQITKLPEPYYTIIPIDNVVNYSYKNGFEWVITSVGDFFYQYDSASYKVFIKKNGEYVLVKEIFHDLEYTPVETFWGTKFNSKSTIQRRSPISNSLGQLDWLLYMLVSENHAQLQSGFPITIMYDQRCTYSDDRGFCESGFINYEIEGQPQKATCPSCSGNKLKLGAGSTIKAPTRDSADVPDMIDGIKQISGDVATLKNLSEYINQIKSEITHNISGHSTESGQPINEKQVMSNNDTRYSVLMDVKKNFERIHSWTLNTVFNLRYGKIEHAGTSVNYGSKFLLFQESEILDNIKQLKEIGAPTYELANQMDSLIEKKYENNPMMMNRNKILSKIEPYYGYNLQDLINLNVVPGVLNSLDLKVKVNFQRYIQKFEEQFAKVENYMPEADFNKKISKILNQIYIYAREENNGINREVEEVTAIGTGNNGEGELRTFN